MAAPGGYFNMFGIIYLITNKINGLRYVGQTIGPIGRRWRSHCCINGCTYLSNAIQKYGKYSFEIKILSRCNSLEEMNHRERYYIRLFNTTAPNGYNLTSGGNNHIFSETSRKKMSESGKKRPPISEETRKKLAIASTGRKRSSESIEKAASKIRGRKASSETINKLSISHTGYKMSDHQKNLISQKNKGKKRTEEHKRIYSESKNSLKVKVFCAELNTVFDSIGEASSHTGAQRQNIGKVIKGDLKRTKGYTFTRINKNEL